MIGEAQRVRLVQGARRSSGRKKGVNLKARGKKHGGAEATNPTEACAAACKPVEVAACKPVEVVACKPTDVVKWMGPLPDAIFGD